ncbi:WD40 repeat domain-containing protein [Thauera phenylacetica]
MNTEPRIDQRCPYVGLQPFEQADRAFFFGRERDQRVIISNLLSSPLTILYGSSGVGKSSVLMAGVVPQLHRERPGTPVVVFRNWVDRDFQLALTRACIETVWALQVDQPRPAETLPLDEVLRACAEAAHETVLVIFDQFEEYFLYHAKDSDAAGAFEAQFARAVNREDVDVGFLVALRDDSLSRLDRFQERIHNLLSNRLRLNHLDTEAAGDAIRKPLAVWNAMQAEGVPEVGIDDELVGELLRQVRIGQVSAGRPGGSGGPRHDEGCIEAPFLQLVMVRLWEEERTRGSDRLRRATLDRLGGADEIVRTHLDDAMARLDARSQAVCASFFDRLVTPSGSKIACGAADLISWAGDLAPHVPAVLQALSDARNRILRTVPVPDNPEAMRYEIYHDVLAPAILDWRQRFEADRQREEALRVAREKAARREEEAQAERERAARRALHRWLVGLGVMSCVAGAGWLYASWEGMRSAANEKAAQSISNAPFDAARALSLALEAVEATVPSGMSVARATRLHLTPTAAAEDALRQAIQASRLVWSLPVSARWVSDVDFSPDGLLLLTADQEGSARIWDIRSGRPGKPVLTFVHDAWVRRGHFLPDGERVLTVSGSRARLWALARPEAPVRSFEHGGNIYSALAASPDGRRLATAGNGADQARVIRIWDADSDVPEPLLTLDAEGAWIMGLAFSPDGCCVATAAVERGKATRTAIGVWSLERRREILSLPLDEPSDAIAFTPDGGALVTASRDSWLRVWEPAGKGLDALLREPGGAGRGEETLWNGRMLAGHGDRIRNVEASADGGLIASAGGDGTARIWDRRTGENLLALAGHLSYVEAARFSPDGRHLATASRDGTVKLWNIEGHFNTVTSIAFGPDGRTLATGSSDRTARIWDLAEGPPRLRHTLRGHADQVHRVAFDPSGGRLVTAGLDNQLRLWDVASGEEIAVPSVPPEHRHKDQLRGVAFSPDGRLLASAGADGHARLYRLAGAGRGPVSVLHGGATIQASGVAFHPRGDRWASSGFDGKLKLWDLSGAELGTLGLPEDERNLGIRIADLAFSPDGEYVAAVVQRRVRVWPVGAFTTAGAPLRLPVIEGARYCATLAYSPDSRWLAVGCSDAGVRLFEMPAGTLVKTITVHKNEVRDIAFSPDGTLLATASNDKTFHVSPLAFEAVYEVARRLQQATAAER